MRLGNEAMRGYRKAKLAGHPRITNAMRACKIVVTAGD
jgi:hypothetical protein